MASICYSPAGIPQPCTGWSVYNSYATDPLYQRRLTIAWTCTFALFFLLALPSLVRFVASGEWRKTYGGWAGLLGVQETQKGGYRPVSGGEMPAPSGTSARIPASPKKPYLAVASLVRTAGLFTLPLPSFLSRLSLVGQRQPANCHPTRLYAPFPLARLAAFALIPVFLLATLLPESQLKANPNRFGFLALACLPPLFLLSAKNGPVSWFLRRGWTAVNVLHRWIGRAVVLLVLLHFGLWTAQYSGSARTAFLAGEKERRGIVALAFLLLIFVSSLPPFRRFSYPVFFVLHYVGIIGFLAYVNSHTVYARNWATWPIIAIYTADIVGRVLSMRVHWVEATALESGMVKLLLPGLSHGWIGGQHLSLRLFFLPQPLQHAPGTSRLRRWVADGAHALRSMVRPFEQHPFSIATAPGGGSGEAGGRGIELYARSCGERTWTGDLYRYVALGTGASPFGAGAPQKRVFLPCLFEGPYGGLPYTAAAPGGLLPSTETVVLLAGGSGMSFVLGVLEELVSRRLAQGKDGRVEVVWAVRQRAHVAWFADRLREVLDRAKKESGGRLRITLRVYLTCDDSLTTAAPLAPSASPTDHAAVSSPPAQQQQPESLTALLPPSTTLHYSRPSLPSLLRETVGRALAPCGHCFPVCRCGELSSGAAGAGGSGGDCANDEEECVGGCGGVASGRELLVPPVPEKAEEKEPAGSCCGTQPREDVEEKPEKQSYCRPSSRGSTASRDLDAITELPSFPPFASSGAKQPNSCCAPASSSAAVKPSCGGCCSATAGGGCCTGATDGPADALDADEDERDRVEGRRLRIRRGGLGVVVCGPGNMVAEARNAVAAIPLAKQVRIGGVEGHVEHYSL
ncbi:hypothetical protein JCM10213_006261 [Rhodosporidiobolus nylandii]